MNGFSSYQPFYILQLVSEIWTETHRNIPLSIAVTIIRMKRFLCYDIKLKEGR